MQRRLSTTTSLFKDASERNPVATLGAGDFFELLDDSLGWAWGYAGVDRRVGYVRSEALSS